MIENKPIKVVLENAKTEAPMPTEGIAPAQQPKNNVQEAQQVIEQQNIPREENVAGNIEEHNDEADQNKTKPKLQDFKGILKIHLYHDLKDYVDENKAHFGITANCFEQV
jgi:hypothetical protein